MRFFSKIPFTIIVVAAAVAPQFAQARMPMVTVAMVAVHHDIQGVHEKGRFAMPTEQTVNKPSPVEVSNSNTTIAR